MFGVTFARVAVKARVSRGKAPGRAARASALPGFTFNCRKGEDLGPMKLSVSNSGPFFRDLSMVSPSRIIGIGLLLAASLVRAWADDQVRSTQEELRRRNIYFGEIDGLQSTELSEAIKNYQQRKGFAVTGQADAETLRSLGLLPRQPGEPPPKELAWPTGPVLQSDAKIDVAATARQIATQNDVSVESIAPSPTPVPEAASARPRSKRPHHNPTNPTPSRNRRAGERGGIRDSAPPAIGEYISSYLKAASRNDLRREIQFFADRLTYFHNGQLDRRVVERALLEYEQEWKKRRYDLAGPVRYRNLPEKGEINVEFRVNFVLKRGRLVVKGQTINNVIINAATADPRIVNIQEQRVRR